MFFKYLARKHYLREIDKGRITVQEVAVYYNTSVKNVEAAYTEYVNSKNPFQKSDHQVVKWIIETFISLLSVLLVLFTLFEMQEERNAAYRPNISLNSAKIIFAWDENGSFVNDYSLLTDRFGMADSLERYFKGFNVNIPIQNTGVGVAKDVCVDWNYEENLAKFQQLFEESAGVTVAVAGNQIFIESNGLTMGSFFSDEPLYLFGYLQNSFEISETIQIPHYFVELYELAYSNGLWRSIPEIRFRIICKDVQGEEYSKWYIISPTPELVASHLEGGGAGMVKLGIYELRQDHLSITDRALLLAVGFIAGVGVCLLLGASCCLVAFLVARRKRRKSHNNPTVAAASEKSE